MRDSTDPIERVGCAAEVLGRHVLAHQVAVRAMISASVTRGDVATMRPGYRFGLIDQALAPVARDGPATVDDDTLAQLKLDLAVIISAEAMLTLVDMCGLSAEDAIASAVHTARVVTQAALRAPASQS